MVSISGGGLFGGNVINYQFLFKMKLSTYLGFNIDSYHISIFNLFLFHLIFDLGGSTGQLNQQPQPRINLPRHVDVVSSDDTQPSWSGLHHTQVNSNGQASSSGVYSGPPGSNNVGSLGRSVMRRLHDSGFSPDASRGDHRWTGKILSSFKKDSVYLKSWSDIHFFGGKLCNTFHVTFLVAECSCLVHVV